MDSARMNKQFQCTNIVTCWHFDRESDRFTLDDTANLPLLRV